MLATLTSNDNNNNHDDDDHHHPKMSHIDKSQHNHKYA